MQTKADPKTVIVAGEARIPVIACGSRWLVVDKPCGMSIHNDPGSGLCSLALAAVRAGHLPAMRRDLPAMHAVHRIDRDTSGQGKRMPCTLIAYPSVFPVKTKAPLLNSAGCPRSCGRCRISAN